MEKFVEYVLCPSDKGRLRSKKDYYECEKCGTRYKVTNGIPNLIPDEAENLHHKNTNINRK
ncbi:MAG: Trm112 family protein [Ignavibacteria bacterium]|nr:Trm112 family protein [Ignavibacteria bacterium]